MQALERRAYLAAPVLDQVAAQVVPAGKTIQVPITASDAAGNPLHYTVSSDNPDITVSLHPTTNTWLRLSTTQGVMLFQLFNDLAPNTVATMSGLVNSGFLNGTKFFALVRSAGQPYYVAGGSYTGTTAGGPGFRFDDEFNPDAIYSNPGVLGMLNTGGKDTNGNQFLITEKPARTLDFNNTIWGQLVRGFDTLDRFFNVPIINNAPASAQKIKSASIVTDTTDAVLLVKATATGNANVTVHVDDGAGGSDSQTFPVSAQADTYNDPPILSPVPDMVSPKNKRITFQLSATDVEGDATEFEVSPVDPSDIVQTELPLKVIGNTVSFMPRKNFTGALRLFVGVTAPGAPPRGSSPNQYDTQQIQIGVGDQPASGSGVSFDALAGVPTGKIAIARFSDSDPAGTIADWSSIASRPDLIGDRSGGVNWGDDSIDDGRIVQNRTGNYSVLGSHVYPAPGLYPIDVSVQGNLGARLTLSAAATVRPLADLDGATLIVNGTSGDDVIGISAKGGFLFANVNGYVQKYPADGINRVNIFAFDGDDRVSIGSGVPGSYVDAGAGNDSVDGGDGNDTLTGGAGKNTLNGNGGNDRLNGSGGHDILNGGEGDDFLYGNGGDDVLDGGSGSDHLFAGDGNDLLIGGGGADKLYGQAGNDTLIGGKGSDIEDGGDGSDTGQQDSLDTITSVETFM